MKTKKPAIFPFLFLLLSLNSFAAKLPQDIAVGQALEWMQGNPVMGAVERSVAHVSVFPEEGHGVYVVELAPRGYLVLNSDDALPLVVAFSAESTVNLSESPENAFRSMLLRYIGRTEQLLQDPVALKALLVKPEGSVMAVTELYGPFLTTTWNQCNPYNKFCPDNPWGDAYYDYRCAVGCVPVAYGQVMNFHRWPVHGTGTHSYTDNSGEITGSHSAVFSDPYDWNLMQPSYYAYGSAPAAQENAVGEIMYELGVAVEINYEPTYASSSTFMLGNRLSDFFFYEGVSTHSSLASLVSPLEADLRAGFPCIVSIPGHAIVADGLMVDDGVTTYHINYGWGGANNGWWEANNVAGDALDDGVTSIRPQLLAFPAEGSVTGVVDQALELQWILPKRRETEADTLTVYNLATQPGLWGSSASILPGNNSGWSISGSGRTGDCWYAGPNGPAAMVLDEILVPDAFTTLSFWLSRRLGTATFSLKVSTDGGQNFQEVFSDNDNYSLSWQEQEVALGGYAGQQVMLRLELTSGSYYPTTGGVWIDDLSVNSGSWLDWDTFYTDSTLASRRFSSIENELDDCDDFSVFENTSTSSYKDWICAATGGVENCFYKQPGGYSNKEYHLTSLATVPVTGNTRLLIRVKYKLYADEFRVLVSSDGVNYDEVWSALGSVDWCNIPVELYDYAGQDVYIRFEYVPGGYYSDGGVWIDTVYTQLVTNPEYEGQPVHYTEIPSPPAGVHTLRAVLTDTSLVDHALGPAFTLSVFDNDGMPTWWEELYGLDPFSDDSGLDPDTDTFTNGDEYIAGTHPRQTGSFFAIDILGRTISWPAISDRTYRVKYADHPAGPYQTLQTLPGPTSEYTDNSPATTRFYKVEVTQ